MMLIQKVRWKDERNWKCWKSKRKDVSDIFEQEEEQILDLKKTLLQWHWNEDIFEKAIYRHYTLHDHAIWLNITIISETMWREVSLWPWLTGWFFFVLLGVGWLITTLSGDGCDQSNNVGPLYHIDWLTLMTVNTTEAVQQRVRIKDYW